MFVAIFHQQKWELQPPWNGCQMDVLANNVQWLPETRPGRVSEMEHRRVKLEFASVVTRSFRQNFLENM